MHLSSVVVIRRAEPEVKPEVAQGTGYISFLEVNQQTESTGTFKLGAFSLPYLALISVFASWRG